MERAMYRVYKLDDSHLRQYEDDYGKFKNRVCLIEKYYREFDTIEEAVQRLKEDRDDDTYEYVILPVFRI